MTPPAGPTLAEARWQTQVTDVATRYGWRYLHIPQSAFRKHGVLRGWPDLALLKGNRIVYAELKTTVGRLDDAQRDILAILHRSGAEVTVWRPGDMPTVIHVLGPRQQRAVLPPMLLAALGLVP